MKKNYHCCSVLCLLGLLLGIWAASVWGYLFVFSLEKEYLKAVCEIQTWKWTDEKGLQMDIVANVELPQHQIISNQTASFPCRFAPKAIQKRSNCPLINKNYSFQCYWKNSTENLLYENRPNVSIFLILTVVLTSLILLAYLIFIYLLCKRGPVPKKDKDDSI